MNYDLDPLIGSNNVTSYTVSLQVI